MKRLFYPKGKNRPHDNTCLVDTIVVISSMTKTTIYVHKKQRINQLNSGEKYETIQRSKDKNTRLLRAEALARAEEDDLLLSCSVLLAFSPDLPQISYCVHAAPPRSFQFCFAVCPSTVIPPLRHHHRAENYSLPQLKSQPRNRSLDASTYKEVWLDGSRPWLFWLTLSFPDFSRLFLYLAVVGCVSMVLLSVAAGARAGSVTVAWGLGRRRGKIAPEAAREKCVLNQPGPARPPPRA